MINVERVDNINVRLHPETNTPIIVCMATLVIDMIMPTDDSYATIGKKLMRDLSQAIIRDDDTDLGL